MSSIETIKPVSEQTTEIRFKDLDAKNKAKIIGLKVAIVASALFLGAAAATAIWFATPFIVGPISLFMLKLSAVIGGGATIAAVSGAISKKIGQLEDKIRQDDAAGKADRFVSHMDVSIN